MKKIIIILCLMGAASLTKAAVTLADWTFETSQPVGSGSTIDNIHAESGYFTASTSASYADTSIASGYHANPGSGGVYSTATGNGSASSLSSTHWSVGDYYQFTTSTVGYTGTSIQWDQTGSSTGPGDFVLQYSINGTSFTTLGSDYTVLVNASPNPVWNTTTSSAIYTYTPDLSSIDSTIDNQSTVYFRLVDNSTTSIGGATVGTAGTDRVDNFIVNAVPEPATWGAISALGLLGICGLREWRQRKQA